MHFEPADLIAFATGFSVVMVAGITLRILLGFRLNLYFLSVEHSELEQAIIPITTEGKKRSLWRTLIRRRWREDVDLTLTDDQGATFTFRVGFHLWNRFYLVLKNGPETAAALNGRVLQPGRRTWLRTGYELRMGDRRYSILVSHQ